MRIKRRVEEKFSFQWNFEKLGKCSRLTEVGVNFYDLEILPFMEHLMSVLQESET